jgi:hypothetical protein
MDYFFIALIFIAGIIFFTYRSYQKRQRRPVIDQVGMADLGFTPASYPEAALKRSVNQIHTKYPDQVLSMHDVFLQDHTDYQLFLFDLLDEAGKQPTILAQDVLAVFSAGFNFPRITILTRPNMSGSLGNVVGKFLDRLANWEDNLQGLRQVEIKSSAELQQRYMIFAVDENAAREFLTPDRLDYLSKLGNHYAIDLGGDIFTLIPVIPKAALSRRERIDEYVRDARSLATVFS